MSPSGPSRLDRWLSGDGWLVELLLPRTDAGVAAQGATVVVVLALLLVPARRAGVAQLWVGVLVLTTSLFVLRSLH